MRVWFYFVLFTLFFLTGCGGGGGGSSAPSTPIPPDPPSPGAVADDEVSLVENNETTIDVLSNDTNVVSTSLAVSRVPEHGSALVASGRILYAPDPDFVGEDTLRYSVDGEDGQSLAAEVSITVTPVTLTQLETQTLTIPQSGYASINDAELGLSVLASAPIEFTVPGNPISVLVTLTGSGTNIENGGLFVSVLTSPAGQFPGFHRLVNFCNDGSCTSLVPRRPDQIVESGLWSLRVGTTSTTTENIDFDEMTLTVAVRTGPEPDLGAPVPASVSVKPVLTATSVTASDIEPILSLLTEIAIENQIALIIEPVLQLDNEVYSEVSSSFLNADTQALVNEGDADTINLFFLEGFDDEAGLGGISGSIPASSGSKNGFNGALINAAALFGTTDYVKDTAEIAFHEMGHLFGLYHTTEAQFSFVDVIDDTPECQEAVHDENGDGVAGSTECPDAQNPMFWQNSVLTEWEPLTDDQKFVIFHSPLATPGD